MQQKISFDIDKAFSRLEKAVEPFAKAALFELAAKGHDSVFEQLVACLISIRTYDEVTLPTARRLLQKARTPEQMAALSVDAIDELIKDCTFHQPKAKNIHAIAKRGPKNGATLCLAMKAYCYRCMALGQNARIWF